jgi:Recombination endonuclease VII
MAIHNKMVVRRGEVFGRWTALQDGEIRNGKLYVEVRCSCGTVGRVRAVLLRDGKSHGCMACSGIPKRSMKTSEELAIMNKERNKRYRALHLIEVRQRSKEWTRKWRKENPEKAAISGRISNRKAIGCVNPTGETKSGPCEICGLWWDQLHYDHDHATGLHRGWLCSWCNRQLGWYEKQKENILKYLGKI